MLIIRWARAGSGPGALRGSLPLYGVTVVVVFVALLVLQGFYVSRRYADAPFFPKTYRWARDQHGKRIGLVGTFLQYPFTGNRVSNHVQYLAERRSDLESSTTITTCRAWRRAVDRQDLDFVIVTTPGYPVAGGLAAPERSWTESDPRAAGAHRHLGFRALVALCPRRTTRPVHLPAAEPGRREQGMSDGHARARRATGQWPVDLGGARLQRGPPTPTDRSSLADYVRSSPDGRLVFVDDGSTDGTPELIRAFIRDRPAERIELLTCPHLGKGAALEAGLATAPSGIAAFCDIDLATPLPELSVIIEAATRAPVLAIGSRGTAVSRLVRRQRRARELLGRAYNRAIQLSVVPGITDTQCGAKAADVTIWTALMRHSCEEGFAWDVEVIAIARALGIPVQEVGIEWRHQDGSRVRLARDGLRMLRAIPASVPLWPQCATSVTAGDTPRRVRRRQRAAPLVRRRRALVVPEQGGVRLDEHPAILTTFGSAGRRGRRVRRCDRDARVAAEARAGPRRQLRPRVGGAAPTRPADGGQRRWCSAAPGRCRGGRVRARRDRARRGSGCDRAGSGPARRAGRLRHRERPCAPVVVERGGRDPRARSALHPALAAS